MSAPTRFNPFDCLSSEEDSLNDFAPRPAPKLVLTTEESAAPSREPGRAQEKAAVARLARQNGFTINNLEEMPLPAYIPCEHTIFLKTMRIAVADFNRFQRWCLRNRYTHREAFHELVALLAEREPETK